MEAYITLESISCKSDVNFQVLRTRLIAAVNARIQNGEYTERGLARILGVSQPQLHNVLKGARTLQWELADRLLKNFGLTLADLFTDDEMAARVGGHSDGAQQRTTLHQGWDREIPRKKPEYEQDADRMRRIAATSGR